MVAKILLSLCLLMATCTAFPNGGPIDACVRTRANQPNHGGILPQPENTNPFIVEASTNFWRPGDVITVNIESTKKSFKGFFIQARDARSHEWIGTFEKGADSKAYGECSAVTHTNNEPKDQVTLIWHAPNNGQRGGEVYFIGTVLQSYRTFWSDVVADVRQ